MKKYNIKIYPESILRNIAEEIKKFNSNQIINLVSNMIDIMEKYSGIGLAAPQIGVSKRIIIYKTVGEEKEEIKYLVNPEILDTNGSIVVEEGCLSVPKIRENIKRYLMVSIKGFDKDGKEILLKTDKFWGVILQHEIDHLNGKLFIDYLSPVKKNIALLKYNKEIKNF